jgi:hypothetical protein
MGWGKGDDGVVVLEQQSLTSGTTWHGITLNQNSFIVHAVSSFHLSGNSGLNSCRSDRDVRLVQRDFDLVSQVHQGFVCQSGSRDRSLHWMEAGWLFWVKLPISLTDDES